MTGIAAPSSTRLISRTRPLAGDEDPLRIFGPGRPGRSGGHGPGGFAWLREGAGLATAGVAARIPLAVGTDRIAAAAKRTTEVLAAIDVDDPLGWPGTGPIAVGAIPFANDTPGELVVPTLVMGRDSDRRCWITETGPSGPVRAGDARASGERPPLASTPPSIPLADTGTADGESRRLVSGDEGRPRWTAVVNRALSLIAAGTVSKVVLARQLEVSRRHPFDIRSVVDKLRHVHPSCWTYAMGNFVGASPELLVRRRRRWVESQPMAGTVAQGIATAEDERLVARLEASAKEHAEHALVADDVVARLAPECEMVFAHEPGVVRLSNVAHLATTVAGLLHDPPASALALVGRLHPTPAVAGAPRRAALAAIAEMEDFDRGCYAGPVGWVDGRGDGEWAVALRSAELHGNRAVLTAGAGIVSDSDADAEWRETAAKLEAMLQVL